MQEISVYDLQGDTLTNLVQFDKDVYIYINDSRITAAYQVQFFNSASESALVMESTYSDNILCVKIPNDLLEQPYSITGYVQVVKDDGAKCLYCFKIAIRKKPKPSDWVHVDSKDYVTFKEVIAECRAFAESAETSANKANEHEIAASISATNAKASEISANTSATNALSSENNAKASETHASNSEVNAKESERASAANLIASKEYANVAERAESNALKYEKASDEYAAASKSYAVGGATDLILNSDGDILETSDGSKLYMTYCRENEDTENAKYYYEQSKVNSQNSKESETNAFTSATNAKASEISANTSATNALSSENNAKASEIASGKSEANSKTSETNSKTSENNAKQSETNAKESENNASNSESNALLSEMNAKSSELRASISEKNASKSEINSKQSELYASSYEENAKQYMDRAESAMVNNETFAKMSQSYAVGGASDGVADSDGNTIVTDNEEIICFSYYRDNEDVDNAKYYYEQAKRISVGLSGALLPMGTITYEELSIQTKQAGYMYNISNDFVTDSSFKEGKGISYPMGTNVYYTHDGYWDCLAGSTVTGIKGEKETTYRRGNVNITPNDIGALSTEDAETIKTRIDTTESDISSLKTKTENMQNDISNNSSDITTLQGNVLALETDMSSTKTNVSNLQTKTSEIETNVSNLQTKTSEIEVDVDNLDSELSRQKDMLSDGIIGINIVTDNDEEILTSDGESLESWFKIATSNDIDSLLKTIETLNNTISLLQNMIFTGQALTTLVDNNNDNIITDENSEIYAWWNICN